MNKSLIKESTYIIFWEGVKIIKLKQFYGLGRYDILTSIRFYLKIAGFVLQLSNFLRF